MASTRFPYDPNFKAAAGGMVNDGSQETYPLLLDSVTHRLLVDASITSYTGITNGEAVDAADTGTLTLGSDGSNYRSLLVDSGGRLQVDVIDGGGGGTQYTEDDAAAANPVGNAMIVIRADSLGALVTTDGDNVALRGTNKGELYVKHADTIGVTVASGGIASGAVASGAFASGSIASGAAVDGSIVTLGSKTDAKNTATDTTSVSIVSILKQISASVQAPASQAVTNAGTFAVQVDGNALTSLQLIDDAIYAEDVAAQAADKGISILAVRRDTASTMVGADNDYTNLIVDSSGRLHVNVGNTINVASHAVTNAGTFAVQVDGNALTSLQLIDDTVYTDDAAFTPATSKVLGIGFEADETATDSVDEGDIGAARMTLDRKQIATLYPHTAGGLSTFMASGSDGSSILVATAQAVKASAGQLYGYYLYNPEAAVTFVHFYNTAAASVTVGTTNPLFTVAVPAGSAANLALPYGIVFSNAGWSVAATTTAGGNTAPATGVSAVLWYL